MVSIPGLTEITSPLAGDDLVIETSAGTRRVTRTNNLIRRAEVTLLTPDDINLGSDYIAFWDATDGLLKGIVFEDAIFGLYPPVSITDDVSLDPALHNIQPLELTGVFTTGDITVDSATTDIGGSQFYLNNFTSGDLTVSPAGSMVLFENGASVVSAQLRENTSATIFVRSNGLEAIYSGG